MCWRAGVCEGLPVMHVITAITVMPVCCLPAGVVAAVVLLGAVPALPAPRAGAGVLVQGGQVAGATVPAGGGVAHVTDGRLA